MFDPNALLARVYATTDEDLSDDLLEVFDQVDQALTDGEFDQVDAFLEGADVERVRAEILVGMLTITRAARGKLPSHRRFFIRVSDHLTAKLPPTDEIAIILRDHEPRNPRTVTVTILEGTDVDRVVARLEREPWIGRVTRPPADSADAHAILLEVDPMRFEFVQLGSLPPIPACL